MSSEVKSDRDDKSRAERRKLIAGMYTSVEVKMYKGGTKQL